MFVFLPLMVESVREARDSTRFIIDTLPLELPFPSGYSHRS